MKNTHVPKGPRGTWKTGQRVPVTGDWADQYEPSRFLCRRFVGGVTG